MRDKSGRKVALLVPETATLSYDRFEVKDPKGDFRLRIHGVSATSMVRVNVVDVDGKRTHGYVHAEDLARLLVEQIVRQELEGS